MELNYFGAGWKAADVYKLTGRNQRLPWNRLKQEIISSPGGGWSPDSDDFAAAIRQLGLTAIGATSFQGMCLDIIDRGKGGKVDRVNLLTHANDTCIGFGGSFDIVAKTDLTPPQIIDIEMTIRGSITPENLDRLPAFRRNAGTVQHPKPVGKTYTEEDVQNAFSKDAVFCFVCCHGGAKRDFLQAIGNYLQVSAVGFTEEIGYRPRQRYGPPFRFHVGTDPSDADLVDDYRLLEKRFPNKTVKLSPSRDSQ